MASAVCLTLTVAFLSPPLRATETKQADAPEADAGAAAASDLRRIEEAYALLRAGDRDACLRTLEALLPELPPRSLARYTARVLHGQITGIPARRRQAAWLDRRVIDTLVLVPDEAAFIRAVAAWTDEVFFPVLIEDAWFTPLFVEAFGPARIVRWRPPPPAEPAPAEAGGGPDDRGGAHEPVADALSQLIERHNHRWVGAMRGRDEDDNDPPKPALDPDRGADAPAPAPGLVVLDPRSDQRCAGLALALGRSQPILTLLGPDSPRQPADPQYIQDLNRATLTAMLALNLVRLDGFSAITLAGPYPYHFNEPGGEHNPLCVDDRLGRDDRLIRIAVVGRLLGDPVQSVYQAMCSLFLQPRSALLFNNYGLRPGGGGGASGGGGGTSGGGGGGGRGVGFADYHLSDVQTVLGARMDVTIHQDREAHLDHLRLATQPRNPFGLIWINASSGSTRLKVHGGPLFRDDVPIGAAHAAYIVASFGAANPWRSNNLSAQALAGGAYWYFGAIHEPYLQAFVPSTELIHRATPPTPLAFAARQLPGEPFYRPWKLILIGDPLFALREKPARRVRADPPLPAEPAPDRPREGGDRGAGTGVEPIGPNPDTDVTPAARLQHALLGGADADARIEAARQALQHAAELEPDQLARAVHTLYAHGVHQPLLDLPARIAARHPIADMLILRCFRDRFDEHLAAGDGDAATRLLPRLLGSAPAPAWTHGPLRRWREAMTEAGRRAAALDKLTDLARLSWHKGILEALRQTIADAEGAKAGPQMEPRMNTDGHR